MFTKNKRTRNKTSLKMTQNKAAKKNNRGIDWKQKKKTGKKKIIKL